MKKLRAVYLTDKLESDLIYQIGNGILKKDNPILSERKLSKLYKISHMTVRKVIKSLVEKGYLYTIHGKGNFVLSNFFINKNKLIGLILPDGMNPFYNELAVNIEKIIRKKGYNILYANSDYNVKEEDKILESFVKKHNINTLIIAPIEETISRQKFYKNMAEQEKIHFVCIDRDIGAGISNVMINNVTGAYIAVKYLLELGHINIGVISGKTERKKNPELRITGYKKAIEEYGLQFQEKFIVIDEQFEGIEGGYNATKTLLENNSNITAIFALSDINAFGAINYLKEKGLRIPKDISVIGFDNIESSAYYDIPLTTIKQPLEEMARVVVNIIENEQNKTVFVPQKILLEPQIIIRNSCCSLNIDITNPIIHKDKIYNNRETLYENRNSFE